MPEILINEIKKIIIQDVFENEKSTDINYDDNLIALGLDSLSFIKLVVLLEEYFCVRIPDTELLLDRFSTINKINDLIETLKSEK